MRTNAEQLRTNAERLRTLEEQAEAIANKLNIVFDVGQKQGMNPSSLTAI
jgi:hypothetical protein